MTDSYIQWCKLLHFFSNMAILRERDERCMCDLSASVSFSTNNEAEISYFKNRNFTPLVAEKYIVAIQYR